MNYAELQAHIEEAKAKALKRRNSDLKEAFVAVETELKKRGFKISDITAYVNAKSAARASDDTGSGDKPPTAPTASGKTIPPKYRNPTDPAETWTGRGRQAKWLAAKLAAGEKLESFLIRPAVPSNTEGDVVAEQPPLEPASR